MSCCENPASCPPAEDTTYNDVQDYYGKVLKTKADLKTDVCTLAATRMAPHVSKAWDEVHQEVQSRYYGCGLLIPELLDGARVLDLGSGAGLDCYIISRLVGEKGHVTGLDMTEEQLACARKYVQYHTDKYGYKTPNVDFVQGYIEKMADAGVKPNNYDIIISNCVINLSPDKKSVLQEAYTALKEGGEMYFSDIYADQRVPEHIQKHKVLWGECISGALWWEDLYTLAKEVGFSPPRLVTASGFTISRQELKDVLGDLKFVSVTYRLFKLPAKKQPSSGVVYEGDIPYNKEEVLLDNALKFKTGNPVEVDSEVATILKSSRFAEYFTFQKLAAEKCTANVRIDPFEFLKNKESSGGSCGPQGGCC